MNSKNIEGTDYAIFEIATCNQCASLYLVGKSLEENGGHLSKTIQSGNRSNGVLLDEARGFCSL